MKPNSDKRHLLVTRDTNVTAKIGEFDAKNSREEKTSCCQNRYQALENHVSSLCKKVIQKLHALARVAKFMDLAKRKNLMKAFTTSQFNCCLLIWMFQGRQLNN